VATGSVDWSRRFTATANMATPTAIAVAPTGLCLIRRLDPDSRVLEERYDAIVAEFLDLA